MIAALILAASMTWNVGGFSNEEVKCEYSYDGNSYEWTTNTATGAVHLRRIRPKPKPRDKLNPVEAWHKFCRPDGKVEIPKDTRPKPYKREKPNPHKRKPRK